MNDVLRILLVAAALAASAASQATSHSTSASAASPEQTLASGEVRKIDKEGGKLTIRHGPIQNLDMPSMTMVFRVHDARVLESLKPGDKIRFAADRIEGAYTATNIEIDK